MLNASYDCGVGDAGLAEATGITKLYVTDNVRVTHVHPFRESLRTLYAEGDCGIDDAGLAEATKIKVLHIDRNQKVSTVRPFAATLRWLSASKCSAITDAGIANATRLKVLMACRTNITTVKPFATLRELYGDLSKIADLHLTSATCVDWRAQETEPRQAAA